MFFTAYNTTTGSIFNLKPYINSIKESIVQDKIDTCNLNIRQIDEYYPVFITGKYPSENNIKPFASSILIEDFNNKKYLVTDIRPFLRSDQSIKNYPEYNLALTKTIFNLIMLTGDSDRLRSELYLAGYLYATFLADTITKRFNLNNLEYQQILIISHFFYQSLFFNQKDISDTLKEKFSYQTIKITGYSANTIFDLVDKIGPINNINEYCTAIKSVLSNIKVDDLNTGLILTLISTSWFGTNSKELLAVSLEHIPTWLSIAYTVINEKTYKNTTLGRISDRVLKKADIPIFNKSVNEIVKDYTIQTNTLSFNTFD